MNKDYITTAKIGKAESERGIKTKFILNMTW